MDGYREYRWRGEYIPDIAVWCRERGEQMVSYHGERHVPDPGGGMMLEVDDGAMPQSFWDGFGFTNGWHYSETGRYQP